jgi:hypothetical protein
MAGLAVQPPPQVLAVNILIFARPYGVKRQHICDDKFVRV